MSMQAEPRIKVTKINDAQAAGTSAVTSTQIDQAGFDGFYVTTAFGTAASGNVVKMQSSSVSGSGFNDVAGSGAGNATNPNVMVAMHKPNLRYHQLVATRGTSSTLGDMWLVQYGGAVEPNANDVDTLLDVRSLVSPALGTP